MRSGRDDAAGSLLRLVPGKEQSLDFMRGERLTEQESLHLGTSFGCNPVELFPGFNAFGSGRHAHSVRERRDRPHDIERACVFRNILYERPVD